MRQLIRTGHPFHKMSHTPPSDTNFHYNHSARGFMASSEEKRINSHSQGHCVLCPSYTNLLKIDSASLPLAVMGGGLARIKCSHAMRRRWLRWKWGRVQDGPQCCSPMRQQNVVQHIVCFGSLGPFIWLLVGVVVPALMDTDRIIQSECKHRTERARGWVERTALAALLLRLHWEKPISLRFFFRILQDIVHSEHQPAPVRAIEQFRWQLAIAQGHKMSLEWIHHGMG